MHRSNTRSEPNRKTEETLRVNRGIVEADPAKDTLYIACIERYNRTGNIGKAFVKGFGQKEGAFAESAAYDTPTY